MIENILDVPIQPWMEGANDDNEIVLSSRIRLARNFVDIPFTSIGNDASLQEVQQLMSRTLASLKDGKSGEFGIIHMQQLSPMERHILVEKHLMSPILCEKPAGRSLIFNEDVSLSIMVNEEDHLRIQAMAHGLQLEDAYERAVAADDRIEQKQDYAFNEKFGYLTACPTNVGTGLRASVMMHVPALVLTGQMPRILQRLTQLGYTVRGLYGEGTEALGNIYQLSNTLTMGISEAETIAQLKQVIGEVIKQETACRENVRDHDPVALEDRVFRAYGLLSNARRLSSEEALTNLSELQLGFDMNVMKKRQEFNFNKMLVLTGPYSIQKYSGKEDLTAAERDFYRAQVVRQALQ